MSFWQGLWQALNSPVVIAVLVSGVVGYIGHLISSRHNERRAVKSIQASVMNRFIEAVSYHLLNIEMPNEITYAEDFKSSSSELRTAFSMTLAVFPSKKIMTRFVDFLLMSDEFCNEVIRNSGKTLRDLSKDRKYVKAQMIVGMIVREMCKQLGFPLKKFKYKFWEFYDMKGHPLQAELIEEFEKSGWDMH